MEENVDLNSLIMVVTMRRPRLSMVPGTILALLLSIAVPRTGAAAGFQWTKNTVVVDPNTTQGALTSVSTDGHVLVFNTSDARIVNLSSGQILFLQDFGARRVVGVLRQGPITAVATNAAALTDFIQDGTIQFPTNSPEPTILDQQDTSPQPGGDHLSGEVNQWQYTTKGDADNNDLDFSFDAQKHLNGLDADVKGDGHLENHGFSFLAEIHGAALQKLLFTTPIEGHLKVDWMARTSGANSGIGERRLHLPSFFKEIFVANHIPFLYEINANLIFIPGLGGKKDAVTGGFEVAFDGKGGFAATPKSAAPIKQMDASPKSVEKVTSSALAPHGVVLAVNAPKIAFSFGTASFMEAVHSQIPAAIKKSQSADGFEARLANALSKDQADLFRTEGGAYVQWVDEYDYTGSGPMSVVPDCTTTHFNLTASGGVDAKLLGFGGKGSFDLFSSSSSKTEPDVPACKIK
jgi:hypothetical protein